MLICRSLANVFASFVGLVREPMDDETMFAANALSGRDVMELSVFGNDERVTLCARFDNLGKGASGAAIQNMNLALNLKEETGLVLGDPAGQH